MTLKKIKVGTESVNWIHMGQWPCFVGFTTSTKAFKRELRRMKIDEKCNFFGSPRANATTHTFISNRKTCYVVTIVPFNEKEVSKEAYAALISHEVMHIIQNMQEDYAGGKCLGIEAEAYLMQYLTMVMLSDAWKSGNEKAVTPK